MAAAVIYDGAGSGGTLFEGKKFWVAQRVPTRSRWLELITANGGQIVPLEKMADIMIADHARKDVAPGSYSWTWIEKSVKNGKLEDLEAHRAGPIAGTSRPVGSSQPTRNTRTPFTAADDRALALWVTNAEKQGLSTKGNDIYQQLERINPRHTFQSWRDRWVKYGQFQPRPEVTSSPTASGPVRERLLTTRAKALSNGSATRPTSSSVSNPLPRPRVPSRSVTPPVKPSEGNPFTKAEGEALLDIYDDILNIDETRLIEAWQKFAEENPRHTANEWYKFWMNDIKPLRSPSRGKSTGRKSEVSASQDERGEDSPGFEEGGKKLQIQPVSDERPPTHQHLPTEKERFEHTFTEFAEGQGVEIDLQPNISGRRIQLFDLWTIVMKAGFNSSTDEESTSKWDQIALKLGFEKSREPDAPNELRDFYEWILADFAELRSQVRTFLMDLLNNGGELTEEQALDLEYLTPAGYEEEDQVIQRQQQQQQHLVLQEESGDDPETLEIPSSPPQRIWPSSAKRDRPDTSGLGYDRTLSTQPGVTPYKRQRLDKGKEKLLEIPSTPEDVLTFAGQLHDVSPVKGQEEQEDEAYSSSDDPESMFVKPVKRKIFSKTTVQATKTVKFEPETQDFHFSLATENELGTQISQQAQEDLMGAGESVAAVAGSVHEDSSTQSQTDSQREVAEIQELVDYYVSLGYPEKIVQEAMLATTLETGDVAIVMEGLMRGHGIPDHIEGIWTAEDDRAVRLNEDSEEYARVLLKHKEARCVKRRQLLSQTEVLKDS